MDKRGSPQKIETVHFGMKNETSLDRRMAVGKEIVDELLLICGVIGTTTNEGSELVPVADCLNWLQDLQRALRRDDDLFRPISLLMGKWKVVEKKLLPLIINCRYDTSIVLTVLKILVILTKPLSENTKRAGKMVVDTSRKTNADVIQQQIKLRGNAIDQAELLVEYKRLFSHHSSHLSKKPGTGLLSIFVSLLAEPLSRSGASRTDSDHLTIELVLHLFRNLLSAEPMLKSKLRRFDLLNFVFRRSNASEASSDGTQTQSRLHQELIILFEKELVLEVLLVLGQDMESRENNQYNLLMMELLHYLLKNQDPSAVAGLSAVAQPKSAEESSHLAEKLKQEKLERTRLARARHGHFGTSWTTERRNGKTTAVRALENQDSRGHFGKLRRKNRKAEPFIGSGKALLNHSRKAISGHGPVAQRANETLNTFCHRFMKDCYGPVMKSLKNEFRRDSVRLEEGDKVVFFRIVWFFCQWWRLCRKTRSLGPLIFTLDVFTFNLVLSATDSFHQQKQGSRLAQVVALYSEMMHLLNDMKLSKDKTETIMARGLLDRLFYGNEPLDRLPKLLSWWVPGSSTREYLCDLVELCHVCLKLLESDTHDCRKLVEERRNGGNDKVEKMVVSAADFDVKAYFCRKIVSSQLISMYVHLLGQYKINSEVVNHRIVAMFLRIANTEIVVASNDDFGHEANPLSTRRATLEPMLFNIHLIIEMEKILNDSFVRGKSSFKSLLAFCVKHLFRFHAATQKNQQLFVDCLFRQVAPLRFCESFANCFVPEELRMIAEREVLLDEQRKRDVSVETDDYIAPIDQDNEEDELEFGEENIQSRSGTNPSISNNNFSNLQGNNGHGAKQVDDSEGRYERKRSISAEEVMAEVEMLDGRPLKQRKQ